MCLEIHNILLFRSLEVISLCVQAFKTLRFHIILNKSYIGITCKDQCQNKR